MSTAEGNANATQTLDKVVQDLRGVAAEIGAVPAEAMHVVLDSAAEIQNLLGQIFGHASRTVAGAVGAAAEVAGGAADGMTTKDVPGT